MTMAVIDIIKRPTNIFLSTLRYIGQITLLLQQTLNLAFTKPFYGDRFLSQAKRVGPGSFAIAALVGFFVGMIIALQMAYQMVKLSAEIYIPNVVGVAVTRELAPVLTALIVAGRMGAGITAEIGSMVVTDQVDALRAFGVNPVKYLVVPRFLAMVVMLPILTVFADLLSILGGFVICYFKLAINPHMYFSMVFQSLQIKDIFVGLLKSLFFGMIIALVGCFQGLSVKGGAEGVGKATTVAVVVSFIMVIVTDCLFATIFYFVFNS